MIDLKPAASLAGKLRRDWGLSNVVGLESPLKPHMIPNEQQKRSLQKKIDGFCNTAVFPNQLTVPRFYGSTKNGVWVYRILEGRRVRLGNKQGDPYIREKGVRVVVQENARQARFVMSPLFGSKHDALQWAVREMGADISTGL